MTPNVEPSRKALTELISLCSGQVEKQRRSVKAIQELNKVTQTYIVISCYNDLALIADVFRAKIGKLLTCCRTFSFRKMIYYHYCEDDINST